jgi:AraC-like DNA-binding protein
MFQINYCEYNRSNYDFDRIFRPGGSGDYLFLLFKTPMKCYFDDQLFISRENACILYTPGTSQHYQAVRKFRNSYMHFSTDLDFETRYQLPVNQLFYPPDIQQYEKLMQDIQKEYVSKNLYYQERIRFLTEDLFLLISRSLKQDACIGHPQTSTLRENFQTVRLSMLLTCEEEWTIERLCRETNMAKSQFYHYYKLFFKMAPKAELILARMEKAKTLLTNEALQVQQVAHLCGFTNMQHFSRYFKEHFHCAPRDYQQNFKI